MSDRPLRDVDMRREAGPQRLDNRPETPANGGYLRSRVLKRSIVVGRHKTSVSLEDVFWNELRAIAQELGMHLSQLVARIGADRQHGNLSSAIRVFILNERCRRAAPKQRQETGPL